MNFEEILEKTDTTLKSRQQAAVLFLKHPQFLKFCVMIIQKARPLSVKALFILEVLSRQNFEILIPFIPDLIRSGKYHSDSACRRCLAKIYGLALENNFSSSTLNLSPELKKEILELSFTWLVSEEKVAVKVFSMQNIYELRNEDSWVKEELKGILEKDIQKSTAGYRSRASKILRKL
ncbi:hypothetical protein GCM10023115_50340 [Pontixanthobacter gangjinensis]|uniref:Adenylosuccinate lyase n=1 Tax=Christiangramia aestuarii TaxID=1028746 RepID=A0A7K1LPA9_9FLAO|nr:hypothetical protein [Christiangramia aestuarii]MUP42616.1 hypothetical protein [Christiangramia aestuarii]